MYEVIWGDRTSYIQASNPVQACIETMDSTQLDDIELFNANLDSIKPFSTYHISSGESEIFSLFDVLSIRCLASNFKDYHE